MPTLDKGKDTGLGVSTQLLDPWLDNSTMGCLFDRRTWLGDGATSDTLLALRGGPGGRPPLDRVPEDAGESTCCC